MVGSLASQRAPRTCLSLPSHGWNCMCTLQRLGLCGRWGRNSAPPICMALLTESPPQLKESFWRRWTQTNSWGAKKKSCRLCLALCPWVARNLTRSGKANSLEPHHFGFYSAPPLLYKVGWTPPEFRQAVTKTTCMDRCEKQDTDVTSKPLGESAQVKDKPWVLLWEVCGKRGENPQGSLRENPNN